ncbi:MAG: GH3 auxin-responsive promoter family protein [Kiloniellales bacterium]
MIDKTGILRLYSRYRLSRLEREDPRAAQRQTLSRLIGKAANTRFGRDHRFDRIDGIEDFQSKVPLRRFEHFWEDYWKRDFPRIRGASWPDEVPYFALTSGTTSGSSKYIPVTKEILSANNTAVLDLLAFHLRAKPKSRVLGGPSLMLGGSTALEELEPGIHAGDLSGIVVMAVPAWARRLYYPPKEVAQLPDWERKMAILLEDSPKRDIRMIGGTASWLLLFLQALAEGKPGGLADSYPNLDLIIHGGVSFKPYRSQFEPLLAGMDVELREVYPASEGFLAFADRGFGEGLRLRSSGGLFYEFVPVEDLEAENPRRYWLGNVETGVNYAVVLSSPAGLFGYVIGDTVRFVDLDPPRILITGRTSTSLSAFGEHLIEEEIQIAISEASKAQSLSVPDFSVGAIFPHGEEPRGQHLYVVEFGDTIPSDERLQGFMAIVDEILRAGNDDYRQHRMGDMQMAPPGILAAPPGTFFTWMKQRGKLGGQNKVPRVINDTTLFDSLVQTVRQAQRK